MISMPAKRVLIVDDSLDIARLLRTVLLSIDPSLDISVLPSAEEAILDSFRTPIDLLITDIRLPGITGFDLVKKIRARNSQVAVIMVTALTDARIAQDMSALGVETLLQKPLDLDAFRTVACRYLQLSVTSPLPVESGTEKPDCSPESNPPVRSLLISTLLDRLREDSRASGVLLLYPGHPDCILSGEFPKAVDRLQWVSRALEMMAAQSRLLSASGKNVEQFLVVREEALDYILTCLPEVGLAAVFQPGRKTAHLWLAVDELLAGKEELRTIFHQQGVIPVAVEATAPTSGLPEPPVVHPLLAPEPGKVPGSIDAVAADLEFDEEAEPGGLLHLVEQLDRKVDSGEADLFWEEAANESSGGVRTSGAISFDEARQQGLAPGEF
jgi:CheY-like chemotaxis protein